MNRHHKTLCDNLLSGLLRLGSLIRNTESSPLIRLGGLAFLPLASLVWSLSLRAVAELEPELKTPPPPPQAIQTAPVAPVAAPVDVKPIVDRGNEKFFRGNWRGAIADYNIALRLNPANVDVWVRRGVARFRIGDRSGARADFQRADQLNPDAVPAFLNELLNRAVTAQNWQEAIRVVDQMLVVFPGQATELKAYRARLVAMLNS